MQVIAVTGSHIFLEKDGRWWQRVREFSSPPNITACDCCIPKNFLPLPPNDGINHPTQEEWEVARAIADEEWKKIEEEKEKNREIARKQEEEKKSRLLLEIQRAASLIEQLRYNDAREHCRIYDLNYESLVRQTAL